MYERVDYQLVRFETKFFHHPRLDAYESAVFVNVRHVFPLFQHEMCLRAEMTNQVVLVPPVANRAELAFLAFLSFRRDKALIAEALRLDFDFVALSELELSFFEFHLPPSFLSFQPFLKRCFLHDFSFAVLFSFTGRRVNTQIPSCRKQQLPQLLSEFIFSPESHRRVS